MFLLSNALLFGCHGNGSWPTCLVLFLADQNNGLQRQPQSRLAVIQLIWRHRAHIVAFYDAVPIFNKNDGACDGVTSATMEVMDTIQQLLTR